MTVDLYMAEIADYGAATGEFALSPDLSQVEISDTDVDGQRSFFGSLIESGDKLVVSSGASQMLITAGVPTTGFDRTLVPITSTESIGPVIQPGSPVSVDLVKF